MNTTKLNMVVLLLILSQITLADVNTNQWLLSGRKPVLNEAHGYSRHFLRNTKNGKFLVSIVRRNYGPNLSWKIKMKGSPYTNKKSFMFHTLDSKNNPQAKSMVKPLRYGELFAINIPGEGNLVYAKQTFGLNLKTLVHSSSSPYQWKFTGGKVGSIIPNQDEPKPSQAVGLYNTKIKQHVVYCKRKWGINLRWAKDCKQSGRKKVIDHRKK